MALARERLLALGGHGGLPPPHQALAEAEFAGDLGEALALGGDPPGRLDLELAGEIAPLLRHRRPPHGKLTLFSERSPFVGKSNARLPEWGDTQRTVCHAAGEF